MRILIFLFFFICFGLSVEKTYAQESNTERAELFALGRNAIDALPEKSRPTFDIVISDMSRPEGQGAQFVNIIHKESGLICTFGTGYEIKLQVFRIDANGKPIDIGCHLELNDGAITFYAFKEDNANVDALLEEAIEAAKRRSSYNNFENLPAPNLAPARFLERLGNRPELVTKGSVSGAFIGIDKDGNKIAETAFVGKEGDWFYKMRYTILPQDIDSTSTRWFMLWRALRPEIAKSEIEMLRAERVKN